MATISITGMTAAAMEAIRDQTIVNASIVNNHLILTRYNASTIDAGSVVNLTWANVTIAEATTGPESILPGNPGSLAMKTNGELWLKATGTSNTGWIRVAMPGTTPYIVCTSSTRPSTPTRGMVIYELDTGKTLTWYGGTTGWMPPWGDPWGVVTQVTSTSDVPLSLGWTSVLTTPSAVLRNDRRYDISYIGHIVAYNANSPSTNEFQFWRGINTVARVLPYISLGATEAKSVNGTFPYTPSATVTDTWTLRNYCSSSGQPIEFQNSTAPGSLVIKDIGPNGNPPQV